MHLITFSFDVVSPYAYLAFERLPQALEGLSYAVRYRPVLFAAMLRHHDHKGPAEIEPKRAWTFRQVAWWAHRFGVPLQTPAQHPFNPLPLLRLAHACGSLDGLPNRAVCERLFHHVWRGDGADALDPARLAALRAELAPPRDPDGDEVKQALRRHTDDAIAEGIFGVPTISVGDKAFWGVDALEMVAACLRGDPWFTSGAWEAAGAPRPGVKR